MVCKWTYEIDENTKGWNEDYFKSIGLNDFINDSFYKIGQEILAPGMPVGKGLTREAAIELNLLEGTPVGTSLIDAHAGGLGMLGCSSSELSSDFNTRLSKSQALVVNLFMRTLM